MSQQQTAGNAWYNDLFDFASGVFKTWTDYEIAADQTDLSYMGNGSVPAMDYDAAIAANQNRQTMTYVLIGGAVLAAVLLIRR